MQNSNYVQIVCVGTDLHFKTNIIAELTTYFKVLLNDCVVLDYFIQES